MVCQHSEHAVAKIHRPGLLTRLPSTSTGMSPGTESSSGTILQVAVNHGAPRQHQALPVA